MSNKAKNKLTVCFLVPLDSMDKPASKAGYKEIGSQIIKFAEAIKLDHNMLISHSVISDYDDNDAIVRNLADPKIAELQTIGKKIDEGESSLDKPQQPSTEVPGLVEDVEVDEKPHVVAATNWKPTQVPPIQPVKAKVEAELVEVKVAAPVVVCPHSDEVLIETLLKAYGRVTEKSKTIIAFLVKSKDKEVTADDIATGSGQAKTSVNSWIAQSAPKSLENVKRGVYMLNSSKIKVKASK